MNIIESRESLIYQLICNINQLFYSTQSIGKKLNSSIGKRSKRFVCNVINNKIAFLIYTWNSVIPFYPNTDFITIESLTAIKLETLIDRILSNTNSSVSLEDSIAYSIERWFSINIEN